MEDSLNVRVNSILTSGRKDKTLTYFQYVKEESSGRGVDEVLEGKVNKTDQLTSEQFSKGSVTSEILADSSVVNRTIANKAVTSAKLGDESVLISKIDQEVWDKLNDEYLRLDGAKSMKNHLSMGDHFIYNATGIRRNQSFGASISFEDMGEMVFETIEVDGSEEPYHRIFARFSQGEILFPDGKVLSNGFKTHDRTNIGLLANDGTVGLALTDSDIDGITSSVFTNYDNITE